MSQQKNTEQNTLRRERHSWELQLTQQEIEQLRREREHLNSKAIERPLSVWEQFRQKEIIQEVSALMKRVQFLGAGQTILH